MISPELQSFVSTQQGKLTEAISLYSENRRVEIHPQMWHMMEKITEALEADLKISEIQSNMISLFGWTASKKQIKKISELGAE